MPLLIHSRAGAPLAPGFDPWMAGARGGDPQAGGGLTGTERHRPAADAARRRFFEACANPRCRSGWIHLWRNRSAPVFEGGWSCSAECTRTRIETALRREMDGRGASPQGRAHRIPLGLIMLEQGWITRQQLRQALEAQKAAGGRIGEWLMRNHGVSELAVTRALGLQWSCPVLPIEPYAIEGQAALMPRLFVDAFGALPLRVAAGRILYLGFEDRLDPMLALGIERTTGLRVESGMVAGSEFRHAHERMLNAKFPPVELIEAVSEAALAQALARAVERARPAEARLVRVHDCFWLRMWLRLPGGPLPETAGVADVIGSIGAY